MCTFSSFVFSACSSFPALIDCLFSDFAVNCLDQWWSAAFPCVLTLRLNSAFSRPDMSRVVRWRAL
jgi:hypothetical protein